MDFSIEKNIYKIKTQEKLDFHHIPRTPIAHRIWNHGYHLEAYGQVAYVKDECFAVRLTCYEKEPLARFTEPNSPVYRDSCLEFFINFAPEKDDRFINFEVNANGAYTIGIGNSRYGRIPLDPPMIKTFKTDEAWGFELIITISYIEALYGKVNFEKGSRLCGNIYKCGDECKIPHHIMWSPIKSDTPDFHRPESFGDFIID